MFAKLKRVERKILVKWIRFAHAHQDSHWLPVFLFIALFLDGFLMVIPSIVCLIVAVTISPRRWLLFAMILSVAMTLNNVLTYLLGRYLPTDWILTHIQNLNLEPLWNRANHAILDYGVYAGFLGAIAGLPTQLMTAIMGIADAHHTVDASIGPARSIFLPAILFVFMGHLLKGLVIAILTRYGWLKLEKKFG
ncbi:MAG: hypothetical protein J0L93_05005 [Deltaproteobacteria bacterium]|nr:hypothetical protein [Deltaproteobacteria bacterium]